MSLQKKETEVSFTETNGNKSKFDSNSEVECNDQN